MAGRDIRLSASDGSGDFAVYMPDAGDAKMPGLVLLHEILGITGWIRETADMFAGQGYLVAVPEMFWRLEPGFVADFRIPEQREKGLEYRGLLDHDKCIEDIAAVIDYLKTDPRWNGKIAVTGFCTGGTMAYLSAARLKPDAVSVYYGTQIQDFLSENGTVECPTILHMGDRDEHVPEAIANEIKFALNGHPAIDIFEYPGAGHAFCNTERETHYQAEASDLAHRRTFELFGRLK